MLLSDEYLYLRLAELRPLVVTPTQIIFSNIAKSGAVLAIKSAAARRSDLALLSGGD